MRTASASFEAERVVIAVAPAVAARIRYSPPLPLARDALAQRMFMGAYMKGIATYERPWWRDQGMSGPGVPRLPAGADGRRCQR